MFLTTAADYYIPRECFVVPFLSAVHLDESIYKGALSFNPWRWTDLENQVSQPWFILPILISNGTYRLTL